MKIDPKWGPQLDRSDGTIGKLQLVKRYVLVREDGNLFYPRQGRHTKATKEEADKLCKAFLENNAPDLVKGLHVDEWWCYPRHFDPVCPVRSTDDTDDT